MSTGLTWITITEVYSASSPSVESIISFNDYDEAYSYCDWYLRAYSTGVSSDIRFQMLIYTSGPNLNGRMYYSDGEIYFVPYD
jgi:hypothetical protein